MWPDLDAYRHSGHWSGGGNSSTLYGMNAAYEHFTRRLAFETDADDVGSALQQRNGGEASGRDRGTADFALIDVRSPAAYRAAHLPGAISLPHREITADVLPDGPIVVYCWGPGCNAATKAGAKIAALGRDVKEMIGGFEYYVREGYPVEGEDAARHAKDQSGLVVLPSETMVGCSLPSERSNSSATPMAPAI
jgi:rhodanese-related sulfurtransferase